MHHYLALDPLKKAHSHLLRFPRASAADSCVYPREIGIFYLCIDAVYCGKRRLLQ